MRYESVRAHPFGPFEDATLVLAPGLNVVHGPNEAGKSTWHAALYAGLCGMRKAKGALSREDKLFRNRHRPWDGGAWAVSARVALEDGRRVELRHDLTNKARSRAVDADLADRDYTGDILFAGAPDGSRWLGLDRRSFLGAACVRQAQILRLTDNADVLQEDLQRAAASAGADETAARALELLAACRRERVGSAQAPSKPLRLARDRVNRCRSAVERAQRAQSEHLARQRHIERIEREAEVHEREVMTLRAALAAEAADDAELRAARAAELSAGLPETRPAAERPAPPHPAAAYLAAAAMAAGGGLALVDLALPGLVAGAVGLGLLAWWWLAKRRAAGAVPSAPPAAAAEGQQLLADLRAEADRLRARATRLAEGVDPAALEAARGVPADRLADAEQAAGAARAACHTARGELQQLAADRQSIADAEDSAAAATCELERVERLDRTLATTMDFLKRAEERVHRTVAPVLRATVLEWLSQVTGDRYIDCKVDPESLEVEVRSRHGVWRRAALLSHGAAEQIYLLLRLALARHLVRDPEVCPLILDDVLAACDAERRRAVLDVLHAVSAATQVILFTHEEEVRVWARQRLLPPRDQLIELTRPDDE